MRAVIRRRSGQAEEEPLPLLYRRRRQRRRSASGRRGRRMGLSQDVLGHDVVMSADEVRADVKLTNLDQPLFDEAAATKRDLVDYLDAMSERILPELRDRPLSVIRVLRGQAPFMQKNVPKYTPPWVPTVTLWAEASRREVTYALCNDRRTLLWFANQRAVEFHAALAVAGHWTHPSHLILDIDPPEGEAFGLAVQAALLTRQALADAGMAGA